MVFETFYALIHAYFTQFYNLASYPGLPSAPHQGYSQSCTCHSPWGNLDWQIFLKLRPLLLMPHSDHPWCPFKSSISTLSISECHRSLHHHITEMISVDLLGHVLILYLPLPGLQHCVTSVWHRINISSIGMCVLGDNIPSEALTLRSNYEEVKLEHRHIQEISGSHIYSLVTEGSISHAHDRGASINSVILITL